MKDFCYDRLLQRSELFRPAVNSSFEIWRHGGEPRCRELPEKDMDNWICQKGQFAPPAAANGASMGGVRLIFGAPLLPKGHIGPWTGMNIKMPFSPGVFDSLVRRCKLPQQLLRAFEWHTTAGFCSSFTNIDGLDSKPSSTGFLGMMRLLTSDAIFVAYNFHESTRTTTGIILRACQKEKDDIERSLVYHRLLIGQEMLVATLVTEISMHGGVEDLAFVKQAVLAVERLTNQHKWKEQSSVVNRITDEELSISAHGLTIDIAIAYRKNAVLSLWTGLLLESIKKAHLALVQLPGTVDLQESHSMMQWTEYLDTQVKMQKLDVEFLGRRAANQTAAVYSLFSQRDNLASLSAAVESKKVAEAAKRDSSAMKSIAILTAIFFPGTFIAAVFTLDSVKGAPFWLYWVITIPSTILTLGSWWLYTMRQSRLIEKRELELDRDK